MVFDEFLNDTVSLVKPDGQAHKGIRASIMDGDVMITDLSLSIEAGDEIRRSLGAGQEERYRVLDPGFQKGEGEIPDMYVVKVEAIDA